MTKRTKPRQAASPASLDRWERELDKQIKLAWNVYLALCELRNSIRMAERR